MQNPGKETADNMKIAWRRHATHYAITWAFCSLIGLAQYLFKTGHGLWIPFVYSMLIGTCTITIVELLGYLVAAPEDPHHWPTGLKGVVLTPVPLILGFVGGSKLADLYFGWSSWSDTRVLQTSILISAVAGIAISWFFHMRGKEQALQAQLKATQLQATEAKLKLLEAQLDPHLLFNTLANLRVLIGIDATRAQKMLDHMNAYLRATLTGSRASEHSLSEEYARLRDYLELMQIRMGPRLSFELELPEHLKTLKIPSLLLQPLVENAIKHGLEPHRAGGRVTVRTSQQAGRLTIEVIDTGKGMASVDAAFDGQGFGLGQVRERLLTVYGAQAHIAVNSREGEGTGVTLSWPLH